MASCGFVCGLAAKRQTGVHGPQLAARVEIHGARSDERLRCRLGNASRMKPREFRVAISPPPSALRHPLGLLGQAPHVAATASLARHRTAAWRRKPPLTMLLHMGAPSPWFATRGRGREEGRAARELCTPHSESRPSSAEVPLWPQKAGVHEQSPVMLQSSGTPPAV